jgi:hypothetical protein
MLRGEWALIETHRLATAGHPTHEWRRTSLTRERERVAVRL